MDHAYSILMFCFAFALLLYGLVLYLTKDIGLVPKSGSAKVKDKKTYASKLGKITAISALAPLTSGLIAWNGRYFYALFMLIAGFAVCIYEGVKTMQKEEKETH